MATETEHTSAEQEETGTPDSPFSPIDAEIVTIEERENWTLQLALSSDEMECFASIAPKGSGKDLVKAEEVLALMQDARITEGIDLDKVN
ncbi:MAG: hypothetical protein R6V18_05615, partial [Desulfuromonadaceae bacterium]